MLLPLAHSWPIRCARCGHNGTVDAAVTDLAGLPRLRAQAAICAGKHHPLDALGQRLARPGTAGAAGATADGGTRSS